MERRQPREVQSGLLRVLVITFALIFLAGLSILLRGPGNTAGGQHFPNGILAFLLILEALSAYVAYRIGKKKGRGELGLLLGVVLNWLGVVIIALMGPGYVECGYCREPLRFDAAICPHCHQSRPG